MVLTTKGSYKEGILQPEVLPTRGLRTKGFYNQGSYNQVFLQLGVLQPGVLTTRGSYNQGSNH